MTRPGLPSLGFDPGSEPKVEGNPFGSVRSRPPDRTRETRNVPWRGCLDEKGGTGEREKGGTRCGNEPKGNRGRTVPRLGRVDRLRRGRPDGTRASRLRNLRMDASRGGPSFQRGFHRCFLSTCIGFSPASTPPTGPRLFQERDGTPSSVGTTATASTRDSLPTRPIFPRFAPYQPRLGRGGVDRCTWRRGGSPWEVREPPGGATHDRNLVPIDIDTLEEWIEMGPRPGGSGGNRGTPAQQGRGSSSSAKAFENHPHNIRPVPGVPIVDVCRREPTLPPPPDPVGGILLVITRRLRPFLPETPSTISRLTHLLSRRKPPDLLSTVTFLHWRARPFVHCAFAARASLPKRPIRTHRRERSASVETACRDRSNETAEGSNDAHADVADHEKEARGKGQVLRGNGTLTRKPSFSDRKTRLYRQTCC